MDPQLRWLLQLGGAVIGLVLLIDAGHRQGWI